MSKIVELFTYPLDNTEYNWTDILAKQYCRYTHKRCFKVRKSNPEISIGTCVVEYGKQPEDIIICPHRLLQRYQIFFDCIHLLTLHQPGNELHIVPEVSIPGGSVDYVLVSTDDQRKIVDFVGIELQTMDTTGTVWTERQLALFEKGIIDNPPSSNKSFGMNWKMTAKTILVQLHHKIQTFETINKHLVLVIQNPLLHYIEGEFSFSHIHKSPRLGDSMHFHSYSLSSIGEKLKLKLDYRYSTDSAGISELLGLRANANIGLEEITSILESKISDSTLLSMNMDD